MFEWQLAMLILYREFCARWWRHQMESFSTLLALCEGNPLVTGGFPSQGPVMRSFDVFCDLCINKRLSKQSTRRCIEAPSRSLWRHCKVALLCFLAYPRNTVNSDLANLFQWKIIQDKPHRNQWASSVRNYFSVRTILNSTGYCKSPR